MAHKKLSLRDQYLEIDSISMALTFYMIRPLVGHEYQEAPILSPLLRAHAKDLQALLNNLMVQRSRRVRLSPEYE